MSEKDTVLKPYNPDACCGADCFAFGLNPAEPCWGDVHVADEIETSDEDGNPDYFWLHECEGHSGCWDSGEKFKPLRHNAPLIGALVHPNRADC